MEVALYITSDTCMYVTHQWGLGIHQYKYTRWQLLTPCSGLGGRESWSSQRTTGENRMCFIYMYVQHTITTGSPLSNPWATCSENTLMREIRVCFKQKSIPCARHNIPDLATNTQRWHGMLSPSSDMSERSENWGWILSWSFGRTSITRFDSFFTDNERRILSNLHTMVTNDTHIREEIVCVCVHKCSVSYRIMVLRYQGEDLMPLGWESKLSKA